MKKVLSIFLSALMVVSFTGCSTSDTPSNRTTSYTDENGNFVIESGKGKDVRISEIPYEVPYNSKHFTLSSIDCYENRTSDYSYNLFVVVTLDIGELSDDEGHWLTNEDLNVNVYVTSEKNELNFDSLSSLGKIRWTDKKTIQIVKMSSTFHSNRYSFADSEIVVSVGATQEETYDYRNSNGDVSKLHKEEKVTYKTTIASLIPDAERIPEPLYSYVVKWLKEKADYWAN